MSLDSRKTSKQQARALRWRLSTGMFVLVVVAGSFALQRWSRTSIPPERTMAAANPALSQARVAASEESETQRSPREGTADIKHKYTNHLIHETSPYLLQHAHNPVNWYSWGPEALAKAVKEDKPIFLSVGYSTCYWCHVMERQSFETEEVAKILNEHFIAIKVDREERPDIDAQYMLATQLVIGRGGWPNSLWLTPDGRPWMAGTYFPKARFIRILQTLAGDWKDRRQEVEQQADQLAQGIRNIGSGSRALQANTSAGRADQDLVAQAIGEYSRSFDEDRGGFRGAPKFPPHGVLRVLIHEYRRTADQTLLPMMTRTLDGMWLGGMHDHIGGGFHRYSTDGGWLLPHFEKMLYDNAQLMRAYTDTYALTGTRRYREAVEDIYVWTQREMSSPNGGFYSAMDAGEVDKEGETYVWHYKEIVETLGKEDGELFAAVYNIKTRGNFREESTGQRPGTNIVHLQRPLAELANARGSSPDTFTARMAALRARLLARRNTWVQPRKDDKILTSWNGLMIGALANAGRQLNEPKYTKAAAKAADFILTQLLDDKGRLLRTYRAGEAKLPGYLDDYAYLGEGLLDLHAATGEERWLSEAKHLADVMLAEFEDKQNGAFFFTAASHEDLLMRSKNLAGGGNVPSANGVAVLVLLELNRITGLQKYERAAEQTLDALAGLMWQRPGGLDSCIHAVAVAVGQQVAERLQAVQTADADVSGHFGPVTAHLFSSHLSVEPGETLQLALVLDIKEGMHLYGPNPGIDFLVPSQVQVLPNGEFTVGKIKTPEPGKKLDPILKQVLETYEGRIWYFVPVTFNNDAAEGETTLTVQVKTQACDQDRCLSPRTDEIEMTINVAVGSPDDSVRHPTIFGSPSSVNRR